MEYTHNDHLTGTSVTTDENGAEMATIKYFPFGTTRLMTGDLQTDRLFTGQRLDQTGLYFYNARYYDVTIGRFISADTIVPEPFNPQSLNRYSYCLDNPLKYVDPSGHGWPTMKIGIPGTNISTEIDTGDLVEGGVNAVKVAGGAIVDVGESYVNKQISGAKLVYDNAIQPAVEGVKWFTENTGVKVFFYTSVTTVGILGQTFTGAFTLAGVGIPVLGSQRLWNVSNSMTQWGFHNLDAIIDISDDGANIGYDITLNTLWQDLTRMDRVRFGQGYIDNLSSIDLIQGDLPTWEWEENLETQSSPTSPNVGQSCYDTAASASDSNSHINESFFAVVPAAEWDNYL